jgi:hypothetical protein
VSMDGTIVASCYASIGSELKQLQNTSWIASAYMLTMTSFQYVAHMSFLLCIGCLAICRPRRIRF